MGNKQGNAANAKVDPHTNLTEAERKELEKAFHFGMQQQTKEEPRSRMLGRRMPGGYHLGGSSSSSSGGDDERARKKGLNKVGFRAALDRLAASKHQNLFRDIKKLEHQRKDFVDVISEILFDSFDVRNNNEISLGELKLGISVCLRGTNEAKIEWGFRRLVNRRRQDGGGGGSGSGSGGSGSGSGSGSGKRRGGKGKNRKEDGEEEEGGEDREDGEEEGEESGEDKDGGRRRRGGRNRRHHKDERGRNGRSSGGRGRRREENGDEEDEDEEESGSSGNTSRRHDGGTKIGRSVVTRFDLRREIQKSVAVQRRHQRFIETRALVSAQQLCETLNKQLSDARLSELRIATSQHVEAILLKAESTIDSQVEHAMKLMDIDRDGVVSYHDYKKALTRNIVLLDLMNPFSIHSILEDATSGDPNRVSQVPGECAKACAIPSAHQPRHRGSLIDGNDFQEMMSGGVGGGGRGGMGSDHAHPLRASKSAARIRPGKKKRDFHVGGTT